MEIIVTDRHETVLDSNMSLLEKIGTKVIGGYG